MLKDMFIDMAKARETPARAIITSLVTRYLATFATNDIDERINLFAPDGSFQDPVGSTPIVGHAALRDFFMQGAGMKISAILQSITICGNEAAFSFIVTLDAGDGGQVSIRPTETLVVNEDGLIARMRAYFDVNSIS